MIHLTDDQLGALADGALAGATRAEAERHLEACAACREALAGLVARDRELRDALAHDPGDAYFEDFAARVGGRLRAAGLDGAQARAPEVRGLADWFRSPRKLVLVGALATVVVGAGLVMLSTREVTLPARRSRGLDRAVGQVESSAPAPAPGATSPATPAVEPTAPRDEVAPPAVATPMTRSLVVREPDVAALRRDEAAGAPGARTLSEVAVPSPSAEVRAEGAPAEAKTPAPARGTGVAESRLATARVVPADAEARRAEAKTQAEVPKYGETVQLDLTREPTFTEVHGRNAERLTALAETVRSPSAWDSAAAEWATVLLGTEGSRLEVETRYQLARARRRAWSAGPTEKRAATAVEAFTGFLQVAPAGAQRDSVKAWRAALGR